MWRPFNENPCNLTENKLEIEKRRVTCQLHNFEFARPKKHFLRHRYSVFDYSKRTEFLKSIKQNHNAQKLSMECIGIDFESLGWICWTIGEKIMNISNWRFRFCDSVRLVFEIMKYFWKIWWNLQIKYLWFFWITCSWEWHWHFNSFFGNSPHTTHHCYLRKNNWW